MTVDIVNGKVEHFIYMSSAGVYKKNVVMPHIEGKDDVLSPHKYSWVGHSDCIIL